jgi:sigma-B regulation protein RsbU (phosphoserine phosphatase)
MEKDVIERIESGLIEKKRNLDEWLKVTPEERKRVQLGPENEQAVQAQLESIETALVKAEDKSLGSCEICHCCVETRLLEMDYTACVCLDHLSDQERRNLESELEFIQVIQRAMMPQEIPAIPGLDLAVISRPAQIVSGDYFDFFQFRDGAHGLVVADAMGHGVAASLIMSSLQTALRTLVPENDSPVDVLKRVNRLFLHNANFTTFVTVFLCRFDPKGQRITFVNAGQNPPLVYRKQADGIIWLPPTGAALGLAESYELGTRTLAFSEGDILLFYTDGVTEATNVGKEAFGRDRLAALVRQNAGLSAQSLLRVVREALNDFIDGSPLEDDITLLACKIEL